MSTSITLEGFYRKAGKLIPWFMSAALVLFVVGVYLGFFVCPIEALPADGRCEHRGTA